MIDTLDLATVIAGSAFVIIYGLRALTEVQERRRLREIADRAVTVLERMEEE